MPVSPARHVAYRILRRVDSGKNFAVDLLQGGEFSKLSDVDRRLVTELVMGVQRWRDELDFQIARLSQKVLARLDPEVLTVLRLGIYQLRFLERIPKPAIVNEAVEQVKAARKHSAAGLVNAVLRKCPPPRPRIAAKRFEELDRQGREAVQRALPKWLLERWAARKWEAKEEASEIALRLAWASTQVPPTTLRVAGGEAGVERLGQELAEEGIHTRRGRCAPGALVVESGNLHGSKVFRQAMEQGRAVIQDEASQLVVELVTPAAGQRVLDLCAAPGLKTGQLAQALGIGTVVACDLSVGRLRTLAKLVPRQVPPEVRLGVVQLDARRELPFRVAFDRILLDAPCSGTGTLARNPEIKWRLRPDDFSRFAAAQATMLRNALQALARGGRLVYATCSLEPEENEQVVEEVMGEVSGCRLLTAEELRRDFPALASLFDSKGYFRTRPDRDGMDGFFAGVMVRA